MIINVMIFFYDQTYDYASTSYYDDAEIFGAHHNMITPLVLLSDIVNDRNEEATSSSSTWDLGNLGFD